MYIICKRVDIYKIAKKLLPFLFPNGAYFKNIPRILAVNYYVEEVIITLLAFFLKRSLI